MRFNFCWRALNWWPILEGPLFLPLSSCGQISSDPNEQRQCSNSCFTNWAPLQNIHIPICCTGYRILTATGHVLLMKFSCRAWNKIRRSASMLKQTPSSMKGCMKYWIMAVVGMAEATYSLSSLGVHWCWGQCRIDLLPGTAPVTDGLWPRSF